MTGNRLTVIVPTRTQEKQSFFLQRSIRSIRQQQLTGQFEVNIVVAVDKGDMLDPQLCDSLGVQCVESHGKSQAAALNGAIRQLDCDYVAFLEDDDRWQPQFLAIAAQALELGGFVSSNQTLIDDEGDIVRFLDFPTPSGWIMHYNTMARVGEFNESFRYHIDNEWLGRLNQSGVTRVHLLERYAPQDTDILVQERPHIGQMLHATKNRIQILRHEFAFPLVQRFTHANSGMAQIMMVQESRAISAGEYARLEAEFGDIPI